MTVNRQPSTYNFKLLGRLLYFSKLFVIIFNYYICSRYLNNLDYLNLSNIGV